MDCDSLTVLSHTRFPPTSVLHGGTKRSLQIQEVFFGNGWNFVVNQSMDSRPNLVLEEDAYGIASGTHRPQAAEYAAWPHNIEHMVLGQFTGRRRQWQAKSREIRFLRRAMHVVTISAYDSWVLASYGIQSTVLPYFPTDSTKQDLVDVRNSRRTARRSETVLMLGTLGNLPTGQGFRETIEAYSKRPRQFFLEIMGFGTEELAKQAVVPDGIKILGMVSDSVLHQKVSESKAVLVHQSFGTGALTRIPELYVAGIPIVATRIAARGYENLSGITIVDNIDEALEALEAKFPIVGPDFADFENGVRERGRRICELYRERVLSPRKSNA
jgi:hypothetical protein